MSGKRLEAMNLTDEAMQAVLSNLQKAVVILTNVGDDEGLKSLQACCGELFKRAAECRREGSVMAIKDSDESESN